VTQKRKLRLTTRFQEIFELLSRSVEKDGCFIWKGADRKRVKFPVMVVQISSDQSVIQVRQSSIHESIQTGEVLYLKLPFRDAALKTRVDARVSGSTRPGRGAEKSPVLFSPLRRKERADQNPDQPYKGVA